MALNAFGQRGYGGRLEQQLHRHPQIQRRTDPRGGLRGQQRITTQFEEVVVDAHPSRIVRGSRHEQRGEHLRDDLLHRRDRRAEFPCGEGGLGQSRPIQLAHRRQRNLVQHHDRRRNHVRGQRLREEVGQHAGVQGGFPAREHIGHQRRRARGQRAAQGGGVVDIGVGGQRVVDLAQFDAEATDLHLEVGAAQIFDGAVGFVAAHQISGAIQPRTRTLGGGAERAGHEAVGGQTRTSEITLGQRGPGQIQFADHPGGHRTQARIQYERTDSRDRRADGDRLARLQRGARGGEDGGLGRAVTVVEQPPVASPAVHQFGAEFVTGDDDRLEVVQAGRIHRFQRARRDQHVRNLFAAQQIGELEAAEDLRR